MKNQTDQLLTPFGEEGNHEYIQLSAEPGSIVFDEDVPVSIVFFDDGSYLTYCGPAFLTLSREEKRAAMRAAVLRQFSNGPSAYRCGKESKN
jgi:hypothetical protein